MRIGPGLQSRLTIGTTSRHHRETEADLGWVQAYMHSAQADCHCHSNPNVQQNHRLSISLCQETMMKQKDSNVFA